MSKLVSTTTQNTFDILLSQTLNIKDLRNQGMILRGRYPIK